MPYTDLLRVTVFLTGAEATALGAITALAAGRDGDTTDGHRRRRLVADLARPRPLPGPPLARRRRRPRRPRPRPHRDLAARRDPGRIAARPPLADRPHRDRRRHPRPLLPRRRRDRRRLRPPRRPRDAHPRGRRARHRAPRRRQVLRRPQLGLAARGAGRTPGLRSDRLQRPQA